MYINLNISILETLAMWERFQNNFLKVAINWNFNALLGSLMCVIDAYVGPEVRTDKESLPDFFEVIW